MKRNSKERKIVSWDVNTLYNAKMYFLVELLNRRGTPKHFEKKKGILSKKYNQQMSDKMIYISILFNNIIRLSLG